MKPLIWLLLLGFPLLMKAGANVIPPVPVPMVADSDSVVVAPARRRLGETIRWVYREAVPARTGYDRKAYNLLLLAVGGAGVFLLGVLLVWGLFWGITAFGVATIFAAIGCMMAWFAFSEARRFGRLAPAQKLEQSTLRMIRQAKIIGLIVGIGLNLFLLPYLLSIGLMLI